MRRCLVRGISLCAILAVVFTASATMAQSTRSESTATGASNSYGSITPEDFDVYPEVRSYIEKARFGDALAVLQAKQSDHENEPRFFNLLGIIALKAGDYTSAVAAFERVVLVQPDNAGAWLDLAIANEKAGNKASAAAYFGYIESQFNPPPELRSVIARQRANMAAQTKPPLLWQVDLEVLAGVDTNANSGLQNSSIPLTFGEQRIDLLLDPAFQARSDQFVQTGVAVRHKRLVEENILELTAGISDREYLHERDFSTQNVNFGAALHRATFVGDASIFLNVENLWLGGHYLLRNIRAIAQIERPFQQCRLGFSVETEWRRYSSLNNLDANLLWGQAGVACDGHLGSIPAQLTLIGRTGIDSPTGDRPGGKTRHNELIANLGLPVAFGSRVDLSASFSAARDSQGYSPLLEQNAIRRLDRRSLRFAFTHPLAADSDLLLLLEDNHFQSNLALFEQNGKILSVGLRHRF